MNLRDKILFRKRAIIKTVNELNTQDIRSISNF